ncbi:hypothetical protein [Longispora urticae]
MSSTTRFNTTLTGMAIATVGYFLPGLYAVRFSPPPQSPYETVVLSDLEGFQTFGTAREVGFGGLGAPVSFRLSVIAFLVAGVLSLVAVNRTDKGTEAATRWARYLRFAALGGLCVVAAQFLWIFQHDVPESTRAQFVADLGGGPGPLEAARHLSPQLNFGAYILLFGLLVILAGIFPRIGFVLVGIGFLAGVTALSLALPVDGDPWRIVKVIGSILGTLLAVSIVGYVVTYKMNLLFRVLGALATLLITLYGLLTIAQGSGTEFGRRFAGPDGVMSITMDGHDAPSWVYLTIGVIVTAFGLLLLATAVRSVIRNWSETDPPDDDYTVEQAGYDQWKRDHPG